MNGWRTRRAFGAAHRLHGMVPPRIIAAIVRTWYNGWCTGRRFQQSGTCIFGCQYEDSIEHYSRCPIVMNFGHRYLNLERGGHNLERFLLLDVSPTSISTVKIACQSAWVATVYITHCRWRHHGGERPTVETLGQVLCELTRGHSCASLIARAFIV